jgi:hypothetical protein
MVTFNFNLIFDFVMILFLFQMNFIYFV